MATAKKSAAKTTKKAPAKKAPATKAASKTSASGNNTKTVLIVVGVVVALFVVLPAIALGVGGVFLGKKLHDNGVTVETSDNQGSINIKDKNGNEFNAGGTQKIPDDFPSEVTVYKGNVVASGKITVDGKTGWTVTVTTPDSLEEVTSSLTKTFTSNGWTTQMDTTSGGGGLLTANNGMYRVNVFTSTNDDGQTTILYTVTPESQ